jgi:hypothetical protein
LRAPDPFYFAAETYRLSKSDALILHARKALGHYPAYEIKHCSSWKLSEGKSLNPGRPFMALSFSIHKFLFRHPVHLYDFAFSFKRQMPMERTIAPPENQERANCGRDLGSHILDIGPAMQEA